MLDCDGEKAALTPADGVGQRARGVASAEPLDVAVGGGRASLFVARDSLPFFPFTGRRHLAALFLLDEGNDLVITSVVGEHPGGGRVAMGVDSGPRAGAMPHEETHHFRRAIHDGKVNRAALIAIGQGHVGQLGANVQHRAGLGEIAGAYGIGKAANGDTVHVRFELGPAFETVAAGEDKLGIVQGEGAPIRAAIVRLDLHYGFPFVHEKGTAEFLRLAFQLIEVRMLLHLPGG